MSTRCQVEFYSARGEENSKPVVELAARVYQHADGYPHNMIPSLLYLERIVSGKNGIFGPRRDDPEWAAAEFVLQFRLRAEETLPPGQSTHQLPAGFRAHGGVYVTHQRHHDIAFLYKVYCYADGWIIDIFEKKYTKNNCIRFSCMSMKYHPKTGKERKN